MGKKTTKTTQNQTQSFNNANTYGQITPQDTQDTQNFRAWNPQIDPGLASQYGNAKNQFTSSFNNPLGGYQTAQTRDAQQRTGLRQLNQDEAQAFRSGSYDVNNQKAGQLGSLAALTAPRILQTGSSGSGTGSGTSTQVQSGDLLGQLIGAGSQVGSAALLTLTLCCGLFVYSRTLDKRPVAYRAADHLTASAAKICEQTHGCKFDNLGHPSCEVLYSQG